MPDLDHEVKEDFLKENTQEPKTKDCEELIWGQYEGGRAVDRAKDPRKQGRG